jgi:hypothetical protein
MRPSVLPAQTRRCASPAPLWRDREPGDGAFGVLVVRDHELVVGDQAGGRVGGWRLVLPLINDQGALQVHRTPSSAVAVKRWVPAVKFWVFTQRTEKLSVPTPTPVGPPGPQSWSTAASQRSPVAVPDSDWLAK